ncbi:MAG TPA: Yip1 family protein [Niabella sp.]|nr:Yip1 family protein [Niabella sp.]
MENIFDNPEEYEYRTGKDIFLKIWSSPRAVFKYIIAQNYDRYVTALLMLSGISRAFDRAAVRNLGDKMSLWGIVAICIILGGLFGWVYYYIYAAMINWTGKWLKGLGDTKSILRVMAYAMIPSIVALLFFIPQVAIYGIEMFKNKGDITGAGLISNILVYGSVFIELVLGVWTIVLFITGISEVQKFSIGKAILNVLLPIFIIFLPLLILGILLNKV